MFLFHFGDELVLINGELVVFILIIRVIGLSESVVLIAPAASTSVATIITTSAITPIASGVAATSSLPNLELTILIFTILVASAIPTASSGLEALLSNDLLSVIVAIFVVPVGISSSRFRSLIDF